MKNGYIYKIRNKINGKIYIGQTSVKYYTTRWGNHRATANRGSDKPLYRSIRKYGIDNFEFKIMLKNVPIDLLCHYETLWIKKLNSISPNGYNLSCGGKAMRGKDNPMYGKTPWNKGRSLTEEEKDNLRSKMTEDRKKQGAKYLLKYMENNPNRNVGRKMTEIQKSYNIINQSTKKPVVMIDKDTDMEILCFISIGQGAKYIRDNTAFKKADYSTINKVCKGIGNTAYGYKWRYCQEGVETIRKE